MREANFKFQITLTWSEAVVAGMEYTTFLPQTLMTEVLVHKKFHTFWFSHEIALVLATGVFSPLCVGLHRISDSAPSRQSQNSKHRSFLQFK